MTDDGWFGEDVAASYDQDAPMFDPAVLEPAVAFLAALAGDGPVLEFAIGTGRIALPLAADRTFTRIVSPRHSRPDTLAPTTPGVAAQDSAEYDERSGRAGGALRLPRPWTMPVWGRGES